jgi:hypothetical protein
MKSIFYYSVIFTFFLFSCNSNSVENKDGSTIAAVDTINSLENIDSSDNLNKFSEGILPYTVDSIALSDKYLLDEKILTNAFVLSTLRNQLKEIGTNNHEYYLNDFLHIDSCLQKMTEEEFNNTLDIGMMKTVKLYAGNVFNLKNGNKAYTWFIKYSTYEACPYSAGTVMLFTTFDKSGNILSSLDIGEISGGGDAPYYSSTELYSVIGEDYVISIRDTQISGGDEENGKTISETTKSEFKFRVFTETGEIKKISEKIGKPVKKYDEQ